QLSGAFQFGSQPLQVILLSHITSEELTHVEPLRQLFERRLEALIQISERERSSFSGKRLRDGVGQAPAVRNSQNEGLFALQQFGHVVWCRYRSRTGLPPSSLLLCAASMNAKISSVSSLGTGGCLVSKNFTISTSSGRYAPPAVARLCITCFGRKTTA